MPRTESLGVLLALAVLAGASGPARAAEERRAQPAASEGTAPSSDPQPGNLPAGKEPPQSHSSGSVSTPEPATAPSPGPAVPGRHASNQEPGTSPSTVLGALSLSKGNQEPGKALCLIPDFLPPFIYVDTRTGKAEPLAYSFRIEKHPALETQPEFRVWWRLLDKAGKQLAKGEEKGAARERFAMVRGFIDLPEEARRLEYGLESGGLALGSGRAEIVGEEDKWPEGAYAALSGLVGAGGEQLILRLPERVTLVDERWKPLKSLFSSSRPRPESMVVIGPRMAGEGEKSYLDLLGGAKDAKLKPIDLFAPQAVGAPGAPAKPTPPTRGIFALVEAVETRAAAAAKGADLVVVVMPQSDPEMGTDRRTYRQGLDWVVSRLMRAGAVSVTVVPPLSRSISEKQLAAYAAACAESAKVYSEQGAALAKSDGLLADKYWTPKGATGRVTGRFLNEAGQAALAGLVRSACK